MTRNYDDHSDSEDELAPDFDANPVGENQRREPKFSAFDEDDEDEYEASDRDTDFTSGYREDSMEEDDEEFEDDFPDEDEPTPFNAADDVPKRQPTSAWREPDQSVAEEPDAWLEKEGYLEEDEDSNQKWPLGLIAVAAVAVVLLAAGGYGVMQQRVATQDELRQLRATLATSTNTQDMGPGRDAAQTLQQSYDKLSANAEALTLENRRLTDTVAGLQAQLGVQQAVLTKTLPAAVREPAAPAPVTPQLVEPESVAAKPVAPKPAATAPQSALPEPAVAQSPAATSSGPWFVNFGSYASRNVAESWSGKLHPGTGKVIIAPNTKDGQTLYRLRVVGLASRDSAQEVARKLEAELRVAALWVGRE